MLAEALLIHYFYMVFHAGVDVTWQHTALAVLEGNDDEMRQTDVCITLSNRLGNILRDLRFILTSVTGSAGEL